MDTEKVKALAEIISFYGLTALELDEGETRIRLEKGTIIQASLSQPVADKVEQTPAPQAGAEEQSVNYNKLFEVKSPLVGVFYSAPSPDSETFVSIGSKVKKGDVLCIIEAMKLMNEITAEQDGEIVDICIKNGDIVEYDQVLFKLF